jgi:hypothetical protein
MLLELPVSVAVVWDSAASNGGYWSTTTGVSALGRHIFQVSPQNPHIDDTARSTWRWYLDLLTYPRKVQNQEGVSRLNTLCFIWCPDCRVPGSCPRLVRPIATTYGVTPQGWSKHAV